jgi:tRNA(Ile)-lysidine synthase
MGKNLTYNLLDNYLNPSELKNLAVAVSGGADSMFLTLITKQWAKKHKKQLVCLIVDHKLRKESSVEAKAVKDFLKSQGLACHILTWEGEKPKSNISNLARNKRYELLTDFCLQKNIQHLLVAHTKNDQAETVLMRIQRGSGIDGLSVMSHTRKLKNVNLIRPLLNINRTEIEMELTKAKWLWVNDPTNNNEKYLRVQVRNLINNLPDKHLWIDRLILLASNAARAKSYLNSRTNANMKKIVHFHKLRYATINLKNLLNLHEELKLRVLKKVLTKISGNTTIPRLNSLLGLLNKLESPSFKGATLLGCEIKLHKSELIIFRELKSIETKKPISNNTIWDQKYCITAQSKGLYVASLGKDGWSIIKKLYNLKKMTPFVEIIYSLPTIYNKTDEIIACPLLDIYLTKQKIDLSDI